MAGCYGNDPFDKYWESRLDRWLDQQDQFYCEKCDLIMRERDLESDEDDRFICPHCGSILE